MPDDRDLESEYEEGDEAEPEEYDEDEEYEEPQDLVILAAYGDEYMAELVRSQLESEDIPAHVQHGMGSLLGMASQANVLVPSDRLEEAGRALEGMNLEPAAGEIPFPGSDTDPEADASAEAERELEEARGRRRLMRASHFVLGVALLYSLFGAFSIIVAVGAVNTALEYVEGYADDADVPYTTIAEIQNKTNLDLSGPGSRAAGTLRKRADAFRNTVILRWGLVVVAFFILYAWARRSPLPALIVSLCLFLVVELGSLAWDAVPTKVSPLWIVLIVVIWILGIQQALEERKARGPAVS